ncbi:MAG: alanine and proline-rich secreted protein Apa [Defluviitaleaceae bacterium]|nr:alanine and proline-rich secreted protein Apa [Defluviitaleaceae bacterium]MCL2240634.1 alanine and proline-rich secreted protein Apa [Defluviitaleaceae bacterium]
MTYLYNALEWASDVYTSWFADWLHIHFVIRTAILLLVLWGALFLLAQFLQYVLGPMVVLFYRHVLFRAYNYLFVETPYEFIYIRYYSKDRPTLRGTYLRLSDKVKKNRLLLTHTRYKGILYRGGVRRVTWTLAATVGVAATLWLAAFGLHQEYYVPALVEVGQPPGNGTAPNGDAPPPNESHANEPNANEPPPENGENAPPPGTEIGSGATPVAPPHIIYPPGYINPGQWPPGDAITLRLNAHGIAGARLRDLPGFDGVVIEIIWDDRQLEYLDAFTPEPNVPGLYWLRVRSPEGLVGYIASHLVEEG